MTVTTGISALVPAAGEGTRLGEGPKCFLQLEGISLLEILLRTLAPVADEVLIGVSESCLDRARAIVGDRGTVLPGGASRQDTLDRLVDAAAGDILLVQDAARPFASQGLCRAVARAAAEHGAAGAFLDPMVPVAELHNGEAARYLDRSTAGIFQAPQAFRAALLRQARDVTRGRAFQSTAQMVISAGFPLRAVPGEPHNIKITTPLDWRIARDVIGPLLNIGNTE